MNHVHAILQHAAQLVKHGWTTKVLARGANDTEVFVEHPRACRFCALGAIARAKYDLGETVGGQQDAIRTLQRALCPHVSDEGFAADPPQISDWNDRPGRTQAEVVALFRRAIAASEGSVST